MRRLLNTIINAYVFVPTLLLLVCICSLLLSFFSPDFFNDFNMLLLHSDLLIEAL